MGGVANSLGGFLGISGGPKAPDVMSGNQALDALNGQSGLYNDTGQMGDLAQYANGTKSANDIISNTGGSGLLGKGAEGQELANALATGPLTGSKFATEQVQNNPILGQLFGDQGGLKSQMGILNNLQNQGFNLKPEDQSLYGQESGNIARQFGQQGNQVAQDLASRGLSNSGAAGAAFSGLAGSQNEMLAQAQQQIAQQRFQNTMNQIGQQQSFVNSLGGLGENAINQQYGRQLQGAQAQKGGLEQVAGLQQGQNANTNAANMQSANFNVANTPANIGDYASAGMGQRVQQYAGGSGGQNGLLGGFSSGLGMGAGG